MYIEVKENKVFVDGVKKAQVSGVGYDVSSAVLAKYLNSVLDGVTYNKKIYGCTNDGERLSTAGVGVGSLMDSVNHKRGLKLEFVTTTAHNSDIYKLTISDLARAKYNL